MGRKMKATKSGKFINPTDQARKEARKRELRKNKKQRLIVRTAVLKGKDPYQILADLERLDRMEYDFNNPPPLNEKVLKDKRRKLKETWDRICRLYSKEDKTMLTELKRLETEYEMKKNELIKQYEAVRSAQEVNLDEIPLPSLPTESSSSKENKSSSILKTNNRQNKQPPGCPPGLPPILTEFDSDSGDDEENDIEEVTSKKKIRFSEDVSDKDNVKEFLKEIEHLSEDKKEKDVSVTETNSGKQELSNETENKQTIMTNEDNSTKSLSLKPPFVYLPGNNVFYPKPIQPAPPVMVPANLSKPPIRPAAPFGVPQARLPMPPRLPINAQPVRPPTNTIPNYPRKLDEKKRQVTTIEAKPQLRNLSADATKFMPLALRVRRDEKQVTKKPTTKQSAGYGMFHSTNNPNNSGIRPGNKEQSNSKDDAYEQFMNEIGGLF